MSYSLSFRAADKAAAKATAETKFDEIVAQQPGHSADKPAALANVNAAIDLLADNDDMDVSVSMNGWLQGTYADNQFVHVSGASINASASYTVREG